jgi:Family of unknown function (DUF5681)
MARQRMKRKAAPEAATPDNKVGYGRPPRHSRFTKGQSGNPKGRPQGRANTKTIVSRAINEKITVHEGEKPREMTKLEGLLQAHLIKAIKGDARSANLVIALVARLGLLAEAEPETSTLSDEDHAILEEYVRRHTRHPEAKRQDPVEK